MYAHCTMYNVKYLNWDDVSTVYEGRMYCSSMVVPQTFAVMARVRIQQNTYIYIRYV